MNLKILTAGMLLFHCYISAAQTENDEALSFIVEPYLQQVNDDSFHVLWETSVPANGEVRLGTAEFNVLRPRLDQTFREEAASGYHQVKVTGLKPDGHYFYQAVSISAANDTLWGPVTPLYIPDYRKMPVSFTVVGDTQGNPEVWGKIAGLMARERPSFVIHVGDLVQYGPNKDDWADEFFRPASELFRFYPFYPAIGNHEMNHDWFYRYVCLPDPEWFYTAKKGNVLFVFANTNMDILPGSDQYKKLEKILAASTETWKIMVHHHPVYTSSENAYGNTWFQTQTHGDPNEMHLKKLYETYGVDVVFNGHIHMYERTWPVAADKVDFDNGVIYVTLGGGGGGLDKAAANKTWHTARTRNTHHFLDVNIAGQTLFARAIDTTGVVFDFWTIEKQPDYKRLNAPLITGKRYFTDTTTVMIQNMDQPGNIVYGQSGDMPKTSSEKSVKLHLDRSATISAFVQEQDHKSQIAEKIVVKLPLFPASGKAVKKVKAAYAPGNWTWLPDFDKIKPEKTFDLDSVSLNPIQPRVKDHFAVRFRGSFSVPQTDVYRFLLESYDGSRLLIDGKEIINNDGMHYEIKKENYVALEKGLHSFEVLYFDYTRRETLKLNMGTQTGEMHDFNTYVQR
ncbi:MAG: metallophosphoesterase [Prolixibacteraceae bacterium]